MAKNYKGDLGKLTGTLGPLGYAQWKNTTTTTGNPSDMAAQPLYFDPSIGKYVTSYSQNAEPNSISFSPNYGSANFSSSFGKRCKAKTKSGKRCKCSQKKLGSFCVHHCKKGSKKRKSRSKKTYKRRSGRKKSRKFGCCGKVDV
jgi:hypothetical protein